MDILNFISWIKGSRIVTSVNASQTLLPVGLKDPKRDDGYLAGAISVTDFASAIVPTFTNCNIAFGEDALSSITSGQNNVGIGCGALENNSIGSENIALGTNVLKNIIGSSFNIGIGSESLLNLVGGGNNVGVGPLTLKNNTQGSANVAMGLYALYNNTTGSTNVAVGQGALYNNTVYDQSVAIGYNALENNNKAGNTAVGYCALRMNQGWRNIAVGNSGIDSGFAAASDNISIGNQAFQSLTTGELNIGIGTSVMNSCNTGSNNIVIGNYSTSLNYSNSVIIGRDAAPTANNQFIVGSTTYNVGAVTTEALTVTKAWKIKINGIDYKIPLQLA
jgi:hypothetical protein